jgi:hypothetical protein
MKRVYASIPTLKFEVTGAIYDTPFLDYEKRFHLAVIHSLIGFDLHKLKFFFLKQKIENLE